MASKEATETVNAEKQVKDIVEEKGQGETVKLSKGQKKRLQQKRAKAKKEEAVSGLMNMSQASQEEVSVFSQRSLCDRSF